MTDQLQYIQLNPVAETTFTLPTIAAGSSQAPAGLQYSKMETLASPAVAGDSLRKSFVTGASGQVRIGISCAASTPTTSSDNYISATLLDHATGLPIFYDPAILDIVTLTDNGNGTATLHTIAIPACHVGQSVIVAGASPAGWNGTYLISGGAGTSNIILTGTPALAVSNTGTMNLPNLGRRMHLMDALYARCSSEYIWTLAPSTTYDCDVGFVQGSQTNLVAAGALVKAGSVYGPLLVQWETLDPAAVETPQAPFIRIKGLASILG